MVNLRIGRALSNTHTKGFKASILQGRHVDFSLKTAPIPPSG